MFPQGSTQPRAMLPAPTSWGRLPATVMYTGHGYSSPSYGISQNSSTHANAPTSVAAVRRRPSLTTPTSGDRASMSNDPPPSYTPPTRGQPPIDEDDIVLQWECCTFLYYTADPGNVGRRHVIRCSVCQQERCPRCRYWKGNAKRDRTYLGGHEETAVGAQEERRRDGGRRMREVDRWLRGIGG